MSSTRLTSQRIKILEYLQSVYSHPTAEQVYKAVKKHLPAISLATVYRNLNLLAAQGRISKFEINNEHRFDAEVCNHCHCVCTKCGKIMDVESNQIPKYAMKKINIKGFKPCCVNIMFTGICATCKGGKNECNKHNQRKF